MKRFIHIKPINLIRYLQRLLSGIVSFLLLKALEFHACNPTFRYTQYLVSAIYSTYILDLEEVGS